jgi:hypothetical protein
MPLWSAVGLECSPKVILRDHFTAACSLSTCWVVRKGSLWVSWAETYVFQSITHSWMSRPAAVIPSQQAEWWAPQKEPRAELMADFIERS